jgi:flagellar biosynthesis/type III secretory pathway protein FliH
MRLKLEVFEAESPASVPRPAEQEVDGALEEARLAAFEKGYSAGWEDASAADDAGQNRLRADFAHQLQEMAFTFHEARSSVLHALEPLLRAVTEVLLPALGRETLAPLVVETIDALARGSLDVPVIVRVSPSDIGTLSEFLAGYVQAPLRLVEDDTLAQGQVWIRSADAEATIDLTAATQAITTAIRGYFQTEPEIRKHG